MSRAPFDDVADFYNGSEPAFGVPNALAVANAPIRVVYQDQITQFEFPNNFTEAWVNVNVYEPPACTFGGVRDGVVWQNFNSCGVMHWSDGTFDKWVLVRNEVIFPIGGSGYYRSLIFPFVLLSAPYWPPAVPLPPAPPPVVLLTPTSTCVGAPDMTPNTYCQGTQTSTSGAWFICTTTPGPTYHVDFVSGPPGSLASVFTGSCPGGFFLAASLSPGGSTGALLTPGGGTIWSEWTGAIGTPCQFQVR